MDLAKDLRLNSFRCQPVAVNWNRTWDSPALPGQTNTAGGRNPGLQAYSRLSHGDWPEKATRVGAIYVKKKRYPHSSCVASAGTSTFWGVMTKPWGRTEEALDDRATFFASPVGACRTDGRCVVCWPVSVFARELSQALCALNGRDLPVGTVARSLARSFVRTSNDDRSPSLVFCLLSSLLTLLLFLSAFAHPIPRFGRRSQPKERSLVSLSHPLPPHSKGMAVAPDPLSNLEHSLTHFSLGSHHPRSSSSPAMIPVLPCNDLSSSKPSPFLSRPSPNPYIPYADGAVPDFPPDAVPDRYSIFLASRSRVLRLYNLRHCHLFSFTTSSSPPHRRKKISFPLPSRFGLAGLNS
ncbi:hypothetical protein BC826DRAFT_596968 [Russula brevipes]|nr:hypothetical protein BC826DRAFT_596968 [Russula brevipes]